MFLAFVFLCAWAYGSWSAKKVDEDEWGSYDFVGFKWTQMKLEQVQSIPIDTRLAEGLVKFQKFAHR